MAHPKADAGARQGVPLHHFEYPPELGRRRLEELAARGDVEEQRADLDRGAARPSHRLDDRLLGTDKTFRELKDGEVR